MTFSTNKIDFMRSNNIGICKECGEEIEDISPDEEAVYCPECDSFDSVVGINVALAIGMVTQD